jgi:hypothetical protein
MVLPQDFVKLSAYFNAQAAAFLKAKTPEDRRDLLVILKEITAELKRRQKSGS